MKLYGLIGFPLGHSFSAGYFSEKFEREGIEGVEYRNFPLENIAGLPAMLADNPSLAGFNVTIPYKELIIPSLSALSPEARDIGAVNCVKITAGGLTGYNTDAVGFRSSLLDLIGDVRPDALILGTGGASKAVAYVLGELGIEYRLVSRRANDSGSLGSSGRRISYNELTPAIVAATPLIINTTPLGMFPDIASCPDIPYKALTDRHFLFDLVYNPAETEFMKRGAARGAKTSNGYDMLVGQAEAAWRIWNE